MRSPLGALESWVRNVARVPYVADTSSRFGGLGSYLGTPDRKKGFDMYGAVSTLYSVVDLTSSSTAQVNWRLWKKTPSGLKADRTEITAHPALSVWNKPSDFFTRGELVQTGQQHVDLAGDGWLLVARTYGIITELWPLRPDRIEPIRDPRTFISGYLYRGPGGEEIELGLDEVLSLRNPDPTDPYRGLSPIGALINDLNGEVAAAKWNTNFFRNSARPGGIIELPETLEDHDYKRISRRWREQHQGVNNAHRVALLELGKWKDVGYSQKDMDFTALRGLSAGMIRQAYRIHKAMLGESDDVNRANAEAADATFARWVQTPRLERWKSMLNGGFLPLFGITGEGVEFDYDNPVPESAEDRDRERDSKTKAWATLVQAGADPVDAAQVVGLPDMRTTVPTLTEATA